MANVYLCERLESTGEGGTVYRFEVNSCRYSQQGTVAWENFGEFVKVFNSVLREEESNVTPSIRGFEESEESLLKDLVLGHNARKHSSVKYSK